MAIDSTPQPCPVCLRPTVLMSHWWGRRWTHVGTWREECGRAGAVGETKVSEEPANRDATAA
jgi:hypothetical protein